LRVPHFNPKHNSVWTRPPKLLPEGIKHYTLREVNSKVPGQPLGQPQIGSASGLLQRRIGFKTLKGLFG